MPLIPAIVHDPVAARALPGRNETIKRFGIVHDHEVDRPALRRHQRGRGGARHDPCRDPGPRGEQRQDMLEQSGVLDRRGRGDHKRGPRRAILRVRAHDHRQNGGSCERAGDPDHRRPLGIRFIRRFYLTPLHNH
jgi:hypothetical protein